MCMRARDRAEGYGTVYSERVYDTLPHLTSSHSEAHFRRTRMPILAFPEAHTSSFDFPFPFPFLHLPSFPFLHLPSSSPVFCCILPKLEIVEGGAPLRSARTPEYDGSAAGSGPGPRSGTAVRDAWYTRAGASAPTGFQDRAAVASSAARIARRGQLPEGRMDDGRGAAAAGVSKVAEVIRVTVPRSRFLNKVTVYDQRRGFGRLRQSHVIP